MRDSSDAASSRSSSRHPAMIALLLLRDVLAWLYNKAVRMVTAMLRYRVIQPTTIACARLRLHLA
jgi:hypothetical protein